MPRFDQSRFTAVCSSPSYLSKFGNDLNSIHSAVNFQRKMGHNSEDIIENIHLFEVF